jgi:hypothetical protein
VDNTSLFVVAMAEECKRVIQQWDQPAPDLPKALQLKHLLWMCNTMKNTQKMALSRN